jgi:hypothetical protein
MSHRYLLTRITVLAISLAVGLGALASPGAVKAQPNHWVNDDVAVGGNTSCADPGYNTIQAAIGAAAAGDEIHVCEGTYVENVVLDKALTLNGAQAGVDARGRAATEAIIAPAAGIGIELRAGSAGSAIDGFEISGGTRGIESTSGPLDGMQILNNRILSFTTSAMFINDSGVDMTVDQNVFDAASQAGGGGIVHFDTDNFDGLHFTNNHVQGYGVGTGFFVDGNHNVGVSASRSPLISGNLFDGADTGANLGSRAFEFGEISSNTFSNNDFDGLQGGIQNSVVQSNTFEDNGRHGLALTSFGNMAADRGAQNTDILNNEFTGNGVAQAGAALFFSSSQAAGTISTNVANNNNITNNNIGATYSGLETIDVTCNWWGAADGPSDDGPGSGDSAVGSGLDFEPWLTGSAPGGTCNGPIPTPASKDDCKKGGWEDLFRADGSTFKNQGDCIQYVNTGK